jgi:hypothetical protein
MLERKCFFREFPKNLDLNERLNVTPQHCYRITANGSGKVVLPRQKMGEDVEKEVSIRSRVDSRIVQETGCINRMFYSIVDNVRNMRILDSKQQSFVEKLTKEECYELLREYNKVMESVTNYMMLDENDSTIIN